MYKFVNQTQTTLLYNQTSNYHNKKIALNLKIYLNEVQLQN